ncbi:hypothetical protein A2662_02290 [Candidatus Giovannonibacteria bacterium RIFCSPHIGHO2_01_FULL_45_33]|nr:MAG: hypothetical protein A2662_02290 [Candidatus Giovannonibacteria bacterium RIFCSPHIGHO2_01_FULL_45_33]OGF69396.1 MAG: hypothetical protein A3C73_02840 [Candidatus Giovannonibacteria bacterium RIFCSPHIGHO2_02_FULL_44_11]
MYRAYLQEKTVRRNHNKVFECFRKFTGLTPLFVADLGCGLGEYSLYGHYNEYAGVDMNNAGQIQNFVRADYNNLDFVRALHFMPTVFVSLFSIECCLSADDKYALYKKIFCGIPWIQHALVGGFFYESKRDLEMVGETGGIVSYQTIEDPSKYISEVFSECRIHMRTPSKMFGDDVIEVWKILSRC